MSHPNDFGENLTCTISSPRTALQEVRTGFPLLPALRCRERQLRRLLEAHIELSHQLSRARCGRWLGEAGRRSLLVGLDTGPLRKDGRSWRPGHQLSATARNHAAQSHHISGLG